MNDYERLGVVVFVLCLLLIVAGLVVSRRAEARAQRQCDAAGGVLVLTPSFGYACIGDS
jgi:uncharacterized membrane protein